MAMNTLIGVSYSPWSEKARWGLELCGLAYTYREYLPMIGEPALRLELRRFRGKVSVPILLTEEGPVADSLRIVEWGCAHGARSIIPSEHTAAITTWNALSERALAVGRERTTLSVARDPVALVESVPGVFRRLGPISRGIGKLGVRFLERKYAFQPQDDARRVETLRDVLAALRKGLAGGEHLVGGTLTYADITMAVSLQFVSPPERIRLGKHSRPHWTVPSLVEEFADVIAWRDRLYDANRPAIP